jgi:phage protein D
LALNDNPYAGWSYKPRGRVLVEGEALAGVIDVEVVSNSHFTADTFRITVATSALQASWSPAIWSAIDGADIAIAVGFEDANGQVAEWFTLIEGQVDDVALDLRGRCMTVTGRDYSARFLDNRTTEKWANLKSSEIAQQLAKRRGLQAVVKATTARAGHYYEIDHAHLSSEQTEWDVLTYLAEREGYDVWVFGQTLYFQPPTDPATTNYFPLMWREANGATLPGSPSFTDIQLSRSLTLAKDVIVKVKSYHQMQEASFTVTVKAQNSAKLQRKGGSGQVYSFVVPNLNRDQALQWAKAKAEEITRHERVLNADMPGDTLLTARSVVRLIGTGTSWDQTYFPDTVTRRLSLKDGYRQSLRAKNHSPQSMVTL